MSLSLASCRLLILAASLTLVGCGGAAPVGQFAAVPSAAPASEAKSNTATGASQSPEDAQRKIIYTATVDIVVKELDPAMAEVVKLAGESKAYIATSEVRGNPGTFRSATYTIRVPVDNFRTLKDRLLALGIPERDMIKSDDVTEEFYDLQGRLKNLRSSQERLVELKKDATVKEVLEIEPQLERVSEKIEQIEGRLKYLTTFAALSTIQLNMREIQDYKPPTAPTFGDRISRTFSNSWHSLVIFGQGVVLFLVALGPWLPLLALMGFIAYWLVRRLLAIDFNRPRPRPIPPATPVNPPAPPEE